MPFDAERARSESVLAAAASDAVLRTIVHASPVTESRPGPPPRVEEAGLRLAAGVTAGSQAPPQPAGVVTWQAGGAGPAPPVAEWDPAAPKQPQQGSSWGFVGRWARAAGSWSYGLLGAASSPALAEKSQQHVQAQQ